MADIYPTSVYSKSYQDLARDEFAISEPQLDFKVSVLDEDGYFGADYDDYVDCSTYLHPSPPASAWSSSSSSDSASRQGSMEPDDTTNEFSLIQSGILKNGVTATSHVPRTQDNLHNLLADEGGLWVDKTQYIIAMYKRPSPYRQHTIPLLNRPSGFGKHAFVDMLSMYVDVNHWHFEGGKGYDRFFRPTAIRADDGGFDNEVSQCLFLGFDLDAVVASCGPATFKSSLADYIDHILLAFIEKYCTELGIYMANGIPENLYENGKLNLLSVAHLIWAQGWSIYLCVCNYDAPARHSGCDPEVLRALRLMLISPLSGGISDGMILGTSIVDECQPDGLEQEPHCRQAQGIWERLAIDMTYHPSMAAAFGFTEDEIHNLCKAAGVSDVAHKIMQDLPSRRFCHEGPDVYSSREVLEAIRSATL
ncbi:hypothetical protein CPB85DRAFT_1431741 [Mucidula mucida]|nr:hypothetical protein CPB85DRAFT_1431741 [Mucidula mucida]